MPGLGPGTRSPRHDDLAASYQALHDTYRQRETIFAATMADRTDWDHATRAQRHLAAAANAELRRRHPGQPFPPLRSAEPEPATQAQRDELTPAADQPDTDTGHWIKDLAAARRTFARRLADRQSLKIPSPDPGYGDLGPAFPAWPGVSRLARPRPRRDPATPKPEILPSLQVLQRAAERDADYEAAD